MAKKSHENPWGNFVGNWDMPTKLPGPKNWIRQAEYAGPNGKIGTARSRHALDTLDKSAEYTEYHIKGVAKNENRLTKKVISIKFSYFYLNF